MSPVGISRRRPAFASGVGAAVLGVALSLAGCSTPLRDARITVPSSFKARGDSGLDSSALDRWWNGLGDSQLSALVEQALRSAPDALSAVAVLEEARATRRGSLTAYTPQGGASGSVEAEREHPGGTVGVFAGSISPSWELGLFGRRTALRRASDADFDVASFTYEASRQSLATGVAGDLFEARGLALQLVEARDTERIARDLARIGQLRVTAGIGAPTDTASLDSDAATATSNRQALEAQLTVSRRTLLVLIGRGTDPVESLIVEPALGDPPPIPTITPGTLLRRRPDVRQAEARLRSAAGNLRLDELALLPSITLSSTGSTTALASGGTSSLWSLAAGLTLPIFDRPRLLAQIGAQRARGEQAVIAYEKAVQTAYGEAEKTLTTYLADRARIGQLVIAERRAHDAFEAQQKGYRAGIVTLTALLDAERTWRSTRTSLSQLRTTTLTDAVNAFLALGGGWSPAAYDMVVAIPLQDTP